MFETLLELDGRLDLSAAPKLRHRLSEACPSGNERLLLDLSRATFIGSAALRAILATANRLGPAGGRLAICAPPQIAQAFTVSGLDAVLSVRSDLRQARQALQT
jgi:anti-anti-sigma factor